MNILEEVSLLCLRYAVSWVSHEGPIRILVRFLALAGSIKLALNHRYPVSIIPDRLLTQSRDALQGSFQQRVLIHIAVKLLIEFQKVAENRSLERHFSQSITHWEKSWG